VPRGRWFHIILLNVHAVIEKCGDAKDSVYGELQQVFSQFPKYHIKIVLRNFMQNWGERIFSDWQFGM